MDIYDVAKLLQAVHNLEVKEMELLLAKGRSRELTRSEAIRLAVNPNNSTATTQELLDSSARNRMLLTSARESIRHPSWKMISRWLLEVATEKEARIASRHVNEYECQRCSALAKSLALGIAARLTGIKLRNRAMAAAATGSPINLSASLAEKWAVAVTEDEDKLILDVRTQDKNSSGQLMAYVLSGVDPQQSHRGFLLPRPEESGWIAAKAELDMPDLYEELEENCELEMFEVEPHGLSRTDDREIQVAVKRDRKTEKGRKAWMDWTAHARNVKEPLNEEALEIVDEVAKELGMKAVSEIQSGQQVTAPATEFHKGQVVALRSNPTETGAIIDVIPSEPENRYSVFRNGAAASYYASQLQPVDEPIDVEETLEISDFHARLSSLQIMHPSTANLYSLTAGKIDFVPYQFRPVLKLIRSDRPRLLIADGVGVGKTIEAGLILREMQARHDIRSVLVICPKPLVVERKWERELRRFDERFTQLDGSDLRFCLEEMDLEGEWPAQHAKTIVPYSLFNRNVLNGGGKTRTTKGLLQLDPPPKFDLVIVDEAHRISNMDTFVHQGVRFLCDHAEAVVFLTATPVQLGSQDLFVLLNVLRPDLVIDRQAFEHMAAPNKHINRAVELARSKGDNWEVDAVAAMDDAVDTPWGQSMLQNNPEFQEIREMLASGAVPDESRVACITTLERQHTFARIINRTRRRDIGQFTVRQPETVTVDFTDEQRELHDSIVATQARIFSEVKGHRNVNFMLTTIRRQAASCLYGLVPLLRDILTRHIDDLSWAESDDSFAGLDDKDIRPIEVDIRDVLDKASQLSDEDPKVEALITVINDKQAMPKNKVMVFSAFRHTLNYLHRRLKAEGLRVDVVHGGTPDEERVALRDRFRAERDHADALDVLLFSEVGCEGLDYEFCDCMVNYDLPWNPMRIEQRIGRIDRRGQTSDSVSIFNLITPGTVDADIYQRCLVRIGVFENEVGGSEEILGEITQQIRNIAEDVTLTHEQQQEKLQQLADNKIRLLQEEQELEAKQMELFGLNVPKDGPTKEVEEATSFWLSAQSLQNLLRKYLAVAFETKQDPILGEKDLKTLRLSQAARDALLVDFRKLTRTKSPTYREWEHWLKGSEPHLPITFEPSCAKEHRDAVLVNPLHPVIRQAAEVLSGAKALVTTCTVMDTKLPVGDFFFAIYKWQLRGIQEDLSLRGVCADQQVAERLMELLERSDTTEEDIPVPTRDDLEQLESEHYQTWLAARDNHRTRIANLVRFRRESLMTSHDARMALLQEQLDQATNDNIRRMRTSQIDSAKADFDRRSTELEAAAGVADITSELVAYGTIRIQRGEPYGQ